MYKQDLLNKIKNVANSCEKCQLCKTRNNVVFGEGNPDANLMYIGEAPGASENKLGRPFVGKAGKLLNKIIKAMNLKREDTYITNTVLCRPPKNRKPQPDEMNACRHYLDKQIEIVDPQIIITLGLTATQIMTTSNATMKILRKCKIRYGDRQLFCTYHPSYLLRNPKMKKETWEDMKIVMKELEKI